MLFRSVESLIGGRKNRTHVGTVGQGRFALLKEKYGLERLLQLLPRWVADAERAEREKGVGSLQFWNSLRDVLLADGFVGGPVLLLPFCFATSVDCPDNPQGITHHLRTDRRIFNLLTATPAEQEAARIAMANPHHTEEGWFVVARSSTLHNDTRGFLTRKGVLLHTFPAKSLIAARKGNWTRGTLAAVQSNEEWMLWCSRSLARYQTEIAKKLKALQFSREGVIPFTLSSPYAREVLLGPSGQHYMRGGIVVATDGSVKKDGSMGAAGCWLEQVLPDFSFFVHGMPKSITPELSAIAWAIKQAPKEQTLTILTDSLTSLRMLTNMQRKDFSLWLHGDPNRSLLEHTVRLVNERVAEGQQIHFAKVPAHSGEPLNEAADAAADKATQLLPEESPPEQYFDDSITYYYLEDTPVVWGPKIRKYLTDKAAVQNQTRLRETRLSRDEADDDVDSRRLMNFTESWLMRPAMGRSTLGAALRRMDVAFGKRWALQTIANMFPGNARLHRWGIAESATCSLCGQADETQSHIQCVCPALQAARIAAHHGIARELWTHIIKLRKGDPGALTLLTETTVESLRDFAPSHVRRLWEDTWARFFDQNRGGLPAGITLDTIGRQRPDAVAVEWNKRAIYILEFTRAGDSRQDFHVHTDSAKVERYTPLRDRLREVVPGGWRVEIIPFTIGIRGSFHEPSWSRNLQALGVAQSNVSRIMEDVVFTTLKVLGEVYAARSYALHTHAQADE